jgi:hypothetical protein
MRTNAQSSKLPGLGAVEARLRALAHATVKIGWAQGPKYADGTSVAQVAAWNEFGTETIPERPALRTGIKRAQPGVRALNKANLKGVIDGRMAASRALGLLGEYGKSEVQRAIVAGPWVPNAPSTIRRKGSSKPLIDTSQVLQTVTYQVTP